MSCEEKLVRVLVERIDHFHYGPVGGVSVPALVCGPPLDDDVPGIARKELANFDIEPDDEAS